MRLRPMLTLWLACSVTLLLLLLEHRLLLHNGLPGALLAEAAGDQQLGSAAAANAGAESEQQVAESASKFDAATLSLRRQCWHANYSPQAAPTDHTPLPFIIDQPALCSGSVFLLLLVHTSVHHRDRRDLIRRTFASVRNIQGDRIVTVFFVGRSESRAEMLEIRREAAEQADVVQADFIDTYRNLTLKNLYAIKWLTLRCSGLRFVMKVDDDVLVNTYHVHLLLQDRLLKQRNFLYCAFNHMRPMRNKRQKWYASVAEWPDAWYPIYCKGFGYIISADLLPRLHRCAKWRRRFWIDDVFVTGALADALGASRIRMESGWDADSMHPRFVGPDIDRVLLLTEPHNSVPHRLHRRVWDAVLQHSRYGS